MAKPAYFPKGFLQQQKRLMAQPLYFQRLRRIVGTRKKLEEQWPKASIVIATYNNAAILPKVLKAMLRLKYPTDYEVIVVNDGSSDDTAEMLKQEFGKTPKIKIINIRHSGVCRARNAGIKMAKFPIVVNMDHDCVPNENWLKHMVSGFDSERVGIVSGYGGFGGTSTAFRKKLLDAVGGYDEDYFYYREDTDLAWKIMELGYLFKPVEAGYSHIHENVKPTNFLDLFAYGLKRLKYHMNDVLLYKKHPNALCKNFLHIKFGFLVDPFWDFAIATGLWQEGGKLELSSPRGMTFIKNKSLLHTFAIVLLGIFYVFAVKFARLIASIRFGKFLI